VTSYLNFVPQPTPPTRKTGIWHVYSNVRDTFLGVIQWHAPWRRYVFCPAESCSFDAGCLTDITNFIAVCMRDRAKAD
jgi:hypothetical protein